MRVPRNDHPCKRRGRGGLLAPSTTRTPPAGTLPPLSVVERVLRKLFIGICHRVGASWRSEPTWGAYYYHGTTQNRPRSSWCVTNTDTQTITPLRRCRLNLSLRLSARHTKRTRHDPRRAPRPRHAHRPLAAPAGQHARSRARRNIFSGSSLSRRRRWSVVRSGRSGTT